MRKGFNNGFVFNDQNLLGLNLGSDFCAEHEWGIQDVLTSFGVGEGNKFWRNLKEFFGYSKMERRKITKIPDYFVEIRIYDLYGFAFNKWHKISGKYLSYNNDNNHKLMTLWSDRGFCAFSGDEKEKEYLEEIYKAFKNKDIIFAFDQGFLMQNNLKILIYSKLKF